MPAASLARRRHAERQRLARATATRAQKTWRRIDRGDIGGSWRGLIAALVRILSAAQVSAARGADDYIADVLRAQHGHPAPYADLVPDGFGNGLASDGRDLADLLQTPLIGVFQDLDNGRTVEQALRGGEHRLVTITATQVADAGRLADQTAMAVEPKIRGYIRQVTLPSCARCIILAGRFYRYSDGFDRHPLCDCIHVPARGDDWVEEQDPQELIDQMRRDHPEQLAKSMTAGDLKALDHGADLNQVVNAHRGVYRAAAYGKDVQATREGVTKRGFAGQRLIREGGTKTHSTHQRLTQHGVTTVRVRGARTPRLTPDQIFRTAEERGWDRTEIVRQLKRFGYVS